MILVLLAIMVIACSPGLAKGKASASGSGLGKAEDAFSVGDYKTAALLTSKIIQAQPKSAAARFLLGKSQRELGDSNWKKTFDVAMNCDKQMGLKIKKYLWNRKGSGYEDLSYLDESHQELVKGDKEFCYRYWVKVYPDKRMADRYWLQYPEDKERVPEAILASAAAYYEQEDTSTAYDYYDACLKQYPDSKYCKTAREKLADFWDIKRDTLYLKGWQSWPIKAGQKFTYEIGATHLSCNVDMDGRNFYISVRDSPPPSDGSYETAGNTGQGVASTDGYIWIRVFPCYTGLDGSVPIKLMTKRL